MASRGIRQPGFRNEIWIEKLPESVTPASGVTPPLPVLSGGTDRSIQRVQKLVRRSIDMIDRRELFL
jgi:hypothetical protein